MTVRTLWALERRVIPIGWFAATLCSARPALPNPHPDLLAGAAVPALRAVVADWPGRGR